MDEDRASQSLKLAEQFRLADDLFSTLDAAAADALGKRECAPSGGGSCDQFGKAVERVMAEESARLCRAIIAWVA